MGQILLSRTHFKDLRGTYLDIFWSKGCCLKDKNLSYKINANFIKKHTYDLKIFLEWGQSIILWTSLSTFILKKLFNNTVHFCEILFFKCPCKHLKSIEFTLFYLWKVCRDFKLSEEFKIDDIFLKNRDLTIFKHFSMTRCASNNWPIWTQKVLKET